MNGPEEYTGPLQIDAAAPRVHAGLLLTLARDLVAGLLGTVLALVLLWYLHGRSMPGWALVCGGLGGILTRRWVRPGYATFPPYVRRFLSVGVVALGTLVASWATLVREPLAYWILRWREAVILPVLAAILGVGLAAVIYTYHRLERELAQRRVLEQDLQVAKRIQQSLLRRRPSQRAWVEVHAVNIASREVGGDYYEVVDAAEDRLCVAVGDVSGKGVSAALLMSSLQSAFLAARSVEPCLDRICSHVNRFLHERTSPESYATFFVAELSQDGVFRYVNAGHNPPLILGDGEPRRLFGGGLPLGLFPDAEYRLQEVRLASGDVVVVYTDGVTEASGVGGDEFGESRLARVVAAHRPGSPAEIAAAILDAVASHGGDAAVQSDDLTLLVLRPREVAV